MSLVTRIFEKLTGRPHQKQNAAMVREAAARLKEDVKVLADRLSQYEEESDPLVAIMTDLYNDREILKPYTRAVVVNGNGHDKNGSH